LRGTSRLRVMLELLDGHVVAGLAAGTAGEERPRDVDHMRRAVTRFYIGTVDSKARVSATTRSANFESRTSVEPSIG